MKESTAAFYCFLFVLVVYGSIVVGICFSPDYDFPWNWRHTDGVLGKNLIPLNEQTGLYTLYRVYYIQNGTTPCSFETASNYDRTVLEGVASQVPLGTWRQLYRQPYTGECQYTVDHTGHTLGSFMPLFVLGGCVPLMAFCYFLTVLCQSWYPDSADPICLWLCCCWICKERHPPPLDMV